MEKYLETVQNTSLFYRGEKVRVWLLSTGMLTNSYINVTTITQRKFPPHDQQDELFVSPLHRQEVVNMLIILAPLHNMK